jgi:hypothetical protein
MSAWGMLVHHTHTKSVLVSFSINEIRVSI